MRQIFVPYEVFQESFIRKWAVNPIDRKCAKSGYFRGIEQPVFQLNGMFGNLSRGRR